MVFKHNENERISMSKEQNTLKERIDELESKIEQQAEQVEKLTNQPTTVSRRSALAALMGLGGLGVASSPASAASGQIGTSSNRVDIFAENIDSNTFTVNDTLGITQNSDLDLSNNNLINVNSLEADDVVGNVFGFQNDVSGTVRSNGYEATESYEDILTINQYSAGKVIAFYSADTFLNRNLASVDSIYWAGDDNGLDTVISNEVSGDEIAEYQWNGNTLQARVTDDNGESLISFFVFAGSEQTQFTWNI